MSTQIPVLPGCRCGCPAHPGQLCLETLDCLCTGYAPAEDECASEPVSLRLESHRARTRVENTIGHALPWICGWMGSKGARAGCTTVSREEWTLLRQRIAQRGWAGIKRCTTCPLRQPRQQQLL
jgi:hypothetical protein